MFFESAFGDLSILQGLGLLTTLTAGWLIAVVLYRLRFHPLAKFPGPFWARISGFPAYLHTLRGDRHVWSWCLQQKYGAFASNSSQHLP